MLVVTAFVAGPIMLPILTAVAAWQYYQRNGAQFSLRSLLMVVIIASVILGVIAAVYHHLPQ